MALKNEEWPEWAKPEATDQYGNVACKVCGHIQSPTFNACISCCAHAALNLTEDWHGPDDGGRWELEAVCSKCGKNFFSLEELLRGYKLVRK